LGSVGGRGVALVDVGELFHRRGSQNGRFEKGKGGGEDVRRGKWRGRRRRDRLETARVQTNLAQERVKEEKKRTNEGEENARSDPRHARPRYSGQPKRPNSEEESSQNRRVQPRLGRRSSSALLDRSTVKVRLHGLVPYPTDESADEAGQEGGGLGLRGETVNFGEDDSDGTVVEELVKEGKGQNGDGGGRDKKTNDDAPRGSNP
jgi:hypothetical protein